MFCRSKHHHQFLRLPWPPWWLSGKEFACQWRSHRRCRFDPGWGRSPGEGHGNPLQYSCLGNPTYGGAWRGTVHGVTVSHDWRNWAHVEHMVPFSSQVSVALRGMMLRWTLGSTCPFQFWFPWCVCPAVGLLGCMAVLFPVFSGISILFSLVAVLVYFKPSLSESIFFHLEEAIVFFTILINLYVNVLILHHT